jgi:hypothetical protein
MRATEWEWAVVKRSVIESTETRLVEMRAFALHRKLITSMRGFASQ